MFILLPILLLLLTAITLLILYQVRPNFRFFWLIASGGAWVAWISTFFWYFQIPITFTAGQGVTNSLNAFTAAWLVDSLSWPFALALVTLSLVIIMTSVVSQARNPRTWGGTLLLTSIGLLAVTTDNIFTLLLTWAALDFVELIIGLISVGGDRCEGVVIAYAFRLVGLGLAVLGTIIAPISLVDIYQLPSQAGLFLLLAVAIRMGVLPVHLPHQDSGQKRGFGTTLRLVTAASSLAILGRLPVNLMGSTPTVILLVLTALTAMYAGWMWIRSADELAGRPYWLLGMGSLAIGAALSGNPVGSIGWGIGLVLSGSPVFLYSARRKSILWLPCLAVLGVSTLPMSLTASGWNTAQPTFWLFWLSHLPGQVLLIAGIIKHCLHPGENAFESLPRWAKIFYLFGLGWNIIVMLLLGLWGWDGAATIGHWWTSLLEIPIALTVTLLVIRQKGKSVQLSSPRESWFSRFRLDWLSRWVSILYRFLGRISSIVSSQLEGDSGLLWSLVILVLLISMMSQVG